MRTLAESSNFTSLGHPPRTFAIAFACEDLSPHEVDWSSNVGTTISISSVSMGGVVSELVSGGKVDSRLVGIHVVGELSLVDELGGDDSRLLGVVGGGLIFIGVVRVDSVVTDVVGIEFRLKRGGGGCSRLVSKV